MNEPDWITLRLLHKLVKLDQMAAKDYDVQRTIIYLRNRYGAVQLQRCIIELNREAKLKKQAVTNHNQ